MNLRTAVSEALVENGFERAGRTHLLRHDDQFSRWVDIGPLGQRSDIVPTRNSAVCRPIHIRAPSAATSAM